MVHPLHVSTPLLRRPRSSRIDEYPPHRLSGDGHEVGPVLPVDRSDVDQTQVGLVHERRRLQRMVGTLPLHEPVGKTPKLAIEVRRQAVEGASIARAPGAEEQGDVGCLRRSHGARPL
jgi:hypothetical protein